MRSRLFIGATLFLTCDRAVYRIQPLDDKLIDKQQIASGSWLANNGLQLKLGGDFNSTSVLLERRPWLVARRP